LGDQHRPSSQHHFSTQTFTRSSDVAPAASSCSDESNETFYKDYDKLIRDIDPARLCDYLYGEFVVSEEENSEIKSINSRGLRKLAGKRLFDIVQGYFAEADSARKAFVVSTINEFYKGSSQEYMVNYLNLDYLPTAANSGTEKLNTHPPLMQVFEQSQIKPTKEACEHNENIKYPVQESGQ